MNTIETLNDDTLICIVAYCLLTDILALRQTCRRLCHISRLRTVWQNAHSLNILQHNFPFTGHPLTSMSTHELERNVRRAYRLGRKWLSSDLTVRSSFVFDAAASTRVTDVCILPDRDGKWLLTVAKGVWSVIRIWDTSQGVKLLMEWCPRGALIQGCAFNSDSTSENALAVSVVQDNARRIDVLSLRRRYSTKPAINVIASLEIPRRAQMTYRPMKLQGDLLAFSDDWAETILWNWKNDTWASLQHTADSDSTFHLDRTIQVLFTHESILVVRAQSIHLFPFPTLQPRNLPIRVYPSIACHSWGWIDGLAVVARQVAHTQHTVSLAPLSVLVRGEVDDPWATEHPRLDLYTLDLNPDFCLSEEGEGEAALATQTNLPYLFPPTKVTHVETKKGRLQCPDVILGRYGTAVWINPRAPFPTGLVPRHFASGGSGGLGDDLSSSDETLAAMMFPGSMSLGEDKPSSPKTLWCNARNNWTSIDYDEEAGRIALGSGFGQVMVLDL